MRCYSLPIVTAHSATTAVSTPAVITGQSSYSYDDMPWLMYLLLIALLAVLAVVIVLIATRKPAAARAATSSQ